MRLCQGMKFGTNAAGECAVSTSNLPEGYTEVRVMAIEFDPMRLDATLAAKVTLPIDNVRIAGIHARGVCVEVTPMSSTTPWKSYVVHGNGESRD